MSNHDEETRIEECPACHGSGNIDNKTCQTCHGRRKIRVTTRTTSVLFSANDYKNVVISCRCGERSTAHIPEPVMRCLILYKCPRCERPFTIQYFDGTGWKIRGGESPLNAVQVFSGQKNPHLN